MEPNLVVTISLSISILTFVVGVWIGYCVGRRAALSEELDADAEADLIVEDLLNQFDYEPEEFPGKKRRRLDPDSELTQFDGPPA